MAKNTKKSQDPTQAALSAIEEALQIGGETPAADPVKAAANDEPRRRETASVPVPPPFADEQPNVRRRPSTRRMAHLPANDDRQSVGQILAALHARPPRMPLYVAAVASAWWIVMAVLIGYSRAYHDLADTAGLLDVIDLPYFWLFFATLVLPPMLFFTVAAMIRRTQEMRLVSRAMTEVTLRLAEPEGVSTDAVVSVSQAIRREVAALGDGIERAIARASELETMVRNEVATLERAYDENELRVRALVDELQSERDAIVSHGTRLREAIGGAHESFSIDVESVAANIDRTLTEATDRINASLTESTTRIADGFITQAETARIRATEAAEAVLTSFAQRSSELTEGLAQRSLELTESLAHRTAEIDQSFTQRTAEVDQSFARHTAEINESFAQRTAEIGDTLSHRGNELAERLGEVGIQVANALDSRTARLTESMNNSMERLVETITTKGNEVHDVLTVRLAASEEAIARHGNQVADRIATETTALSQRIAESVQGFESTVKTHGPAIGEQISQAVDYLTDQTRAALSSLDERTADKLRETNESLDSRISRIEQTIDTRTQSLNETLANRTLELARTISDGAKIASEAVDKTVAGMGEYFASKAQEIAVTISDRAEAVDQTLGKRALEMTENLDSRIQRFEEQVTGRLAGIAETIETRGVALTDLLVSKLDVASSSMFGKLEDASTSMIGKLDEASSSLVGRLDQASTSFVGKLDDSSSSFVQKLEGASSSLAGRLDEVSSDVVHKLEGASSTLAGRLEDVSSDVVHKLEGASSSLAGRLDEVSSEVVNKTENVTRSLYAGAAEVEHALGNLSQQITQTLVERTGETVRGFAEQTQQIAATHEALRENVVGSLDKLIESNRLFKQLLQGVTESLEPLENAVAKRVSNLQTAFENTIGTTRSSVDWIENQMNELRNISSGVLRDLAAVTQRFEGQGRYIASVAETLSETHGRIDQSLEERREAIEHIIRMLVDRTAAIEENFGERSQQIGERLAGFNRLLQESLTTAEQRAQDIARHIIDSTNQISSTITKQHEVIRAGYSEERGRTATALKTTYEEAMEEMKQMFAELQERFTETAREVRDVASEVQTSLDQTRVELKRGVLELPHETRESAEAMRRVVADQLKALAELNEIVSRHAREMEAVESSTRAYRENAVVAGGSRYAAPVDTAASVTEIATARPRAAAPRGEPIEFQPRREQIEAPRRTAAATRPAAPARNNHDEGERGGWLTDLLTKPEGAQDDEPEHTVESLDALSLDIARMIDHDTAVELWDRHKRGERGIFTRRLYTAQGQKTFDEIRRRYRKSNEFRETVDRYIDEFERLLDQVSRDDRGQVLSKTYLTSDTGKVYTLLAHAASRLN